MDGKQDIMICWKVSRPGRGSGGLRPVFHLGLLMFGIVVTCARSYMHEDVYGRHQPLFHASTVILPGIFRACMKSASRAYAE